MLTAQPSQAGPTDLVSFLSFHGHREVHGRKPYFITSVAPVRTEPTPDRRSSSMLRETSTESPLAGACTTKERFSNSSFPRLSGRKPSSTTLAPAARTVPIRSLASASTRQVTFTALP